MKTIKVNTVQGIGDLIWVYRKLAPVCDQIKFNILIVNNDEVQRRSEAFLRTLDKCQSALFEFSNPNRYNYLAAMTPKLAPINDGETMLDYAVNRWLENGVHIDDIDEYPVLWDLNLKSEPVANLPERYLLVYASGSSRHDGSTQMNTAGWVELVLEVAKLKGLTDVVFIGASYDFWKAREIMSQIGTRLNCHELFTEIRQTMYIIQKAEYFISFQSGLCMLSEEFATPTFMIWFPQLNKMQNTWIRKKHIEKKLFTHCFFSDPVSVMLDKLKS